MGTTLQQLTGIRYDSTGLAKFYITSQLIEVAPGDLPSAFIFVFEIKAPLDPKQDVFRRVASVDEVSSLKQGRDAAINAGATLYLSNTFDVEYTDVHTATAAKALILTRVDSLVTDWVALTTQFQTPNTFSVPATSSTVVAAAEAAYRAAAANETTKQLALSTANAVLAAAKKDADVAATNLTDSVTMSAQCAQVSGLLTPAVSETNTYQNTTVKNFDAAVKVFLTQTQAFLNDHTGTDPKTVTASAYTAFAALLSAMQTITVPAMDTAVAAFDGTYAKFVATQSSVAANCSALSADVTLNTVARNTALDAYGTAQTNQALAQAAADAATVAKNKALADALLVCPTFVP